MKNGFDVKDGKVDGWSCVPSNNNSEFLLGGNPSIVGSFMQLQILKWQ